MNTIKKYTVLLFILISSIGFCQQSTNIQGNDLTNSKLENQFNYVINNSNRYKDGRTIYKVVKKEWLLALQNHTLDSLKAVKQKFTNSLVTIATQKETIKQLNDSLKSTKTNVTKLNAEKDVISLFGISMSKAAYNTLLWTIIAGLLAAMLFFIFKFKDSNSVTKSTKKNLLDIETEYEDHRRRALEREQKIMRKLQDEINKQRKDK